MKRNIIFLLLPVILSACNPGTVEEFPEAPDNLATPNFQNLPLSTDKAVYNPGETVHFSLEITALPSGAKVRYKYFNDEVETVDLTDTNWQWTPPADNFRGYMAEVYSEVNGVERIHATTGIDVSSDWTKFPRYGFLSDFGNLSQERIDEVLDNLNKYHINGLQYYDWLGKHHQPLTMSGNVPAASWRDIINKVVYFSTVDKYIKGGHERNMRSMFYNLIYGAWDHAEDDGVKKEWYVFNDNTHINRDYHPLSSPFLSNIYLLDPSNTEWQAYAIKETKKVYQFLDFDGFHMDQLGNRGTRYTYQGNYLNLANTYQPFIEAVQTAIPDKINVLNAVSQYGQQGIAAAPTSFLYTEVWVPYDSYNDLATIIKQNNALSENKKNSVLAAYMNYNLANNQGYFNTASVLMTNAVIFAFGGAHIELGEHMLGKEYFPNNNLQMKEDLKTALIKYYDFLTAYQNLLRDGGNFNTTSLHSIDNKLGLEPWPARTGKVAYFGKLFSDKQVVHLINLTNANTLEWRDNEGVQPPPVIVKDAKISLSFSETVKKIWIASPDVAGGIARSLNFKQVGGKVSFTLPEMQYWNMLVVEF
ncbi:MAG: glycoside hydrolase family 66 protein [Paludibacter sp.]|nr:glycoside hydrolase family 66 protein [Paludibacter sp.]